LKAVEQKKFDLLDKSKSDKLLDAEKSQLEFFRKRGSNFLMVSAIASCLEIFLAKNIPNPFSLSFKEILSPDKAIHKWYPIVEISSSFSGTLAAGLSDGIKNREKVDKAIKDFTNLILATKQANSAVYSEFAQQVA
jgi:hypothetical protein